MVRVVFYASRRSFPPKQRFRFKITSENGETLVVSSEGYLAKADAKHAAAMILNADAVEEQYEDSWGRE